MDEDEARRQKREEERAKRREQRALEDAQEDAARAKRLQDIEERRLQREKERNAVLADLPKSTTSPADQGQFERRVSSQLNSAKTKAEIDDAELEAFALAQVQAEMETELMFDKLMAELDDEPKTETKSVPSKSVPPQPTKPIVPRPTVSATSAPRPSYPSVLGVCEESLVDKKAERKAWLESLMKNEKEEQKKEVIVQKHREVIKKHSENERIQAQNRNLDRYEAELEAKMMAEIDAEEEKWANDLLKELNI